MISVEAGITEALFKFSGQTKLDTWELTEKTFVSKVASYSKWLVKDFHLSMQKIREMVDAFPFWQRRKGTGHPPVPERVLMVGYLLRQFFNQGFRQTQGLMECFIDYFQLQIVPHHTVLSGHNRTRRWNHIWTRFHRFVLDGLHRRKAIIATDATGFSGRKQGWKDTPYAHRANQNWVKVHAAIEVDTFLVLNYEFTESNVHDSQAFDVVWDDIPKNVIPIRSLADAAYNGEKCLQTALAHGATPIHGIKKNAVYHSQPETSHQKLTNFKTHWPNRYQTLYGKRNHAETTFSMIQSRFGYRIRCRSKMGRKNEVHSKINAHNIRMLAWLDFQWND
jgi:transposase